MSLDYKLSKIYDYQDYEYFKMNTDINKIFCMQSKLSLSRKDKVYIDSYNDFYCNYDAAIGENESNDEKK